MDLNLTEILSDKKTVAIGGHTHPDGDCVGSVTGLTLYIKENFPEIELDTYLEEVPEALKMVGDNISVISEVNDEKEYDLFICLDCGDEKRLGFSGVLFNKAKHTLCIDHHKSNESFAEVNHIVPDASSTSELVCHLLDENKMSYETAQALYMGIAHDTGVFQYSCTSPETMETAAMLMRKGIDVSNIIDKTYFEKTYTQNKLLGRALDKSFTVLDGKVIVSVIEKNDFDALGASSKDTEGIVAQLRTTKGVETSLFMYAVEGNKFKISLRSKGLIDVSLIAGIFGGGGHARAAGATIEGESSVVVDAVVKEIQKQHEMEK